MKECFLTRKGPRAIGPYSTAVVCGDTCYLSGVIPVIRKTGQLVEGGAEEQARQVFENMKAILSELVLQRFQRGKARFGVFAFFWERRGVGSLGDVSSKRRLERSESSRSGKERRG